MARGSGASTLAATSGPAPITRSSWSTTSTATAAPNWRARQLTARSMAPARSIGDATKDYRSLIVPTDGIQVPATNDARYGKVLAGPEYFTIFDGATGAALATTEYLPGRDPLGGWGGIGGNGNNDNNGNRGDRMLAAVAYLDGRLPSVIMARGYYGRSVLAAWDWRNGQLTSRWVFDSGIGVGPFPYPDRLAVLGPGQSQSLGCRRRCRRQGRNRLRLDGRGRRRHGTVLDQAAARRRDARQRHGPVETRPRSLRRPRERRPDDRPRHARHGALRRAHRRDHLEHAAWRGCRPRDGRRHRSAIARLRILGRRRRLAWSTARDSALPTHRAR